MSDIVPYDDDFADRFWSRVDVIEIGNECWVWTAAKDRKGYGAISFRGRMLKTHRVAWELSFGAIPTGMMVCHHCDNAACARPTHLFAGTAKANSADMVAKGRSSHVPRAVGERNGSAKITAETARAVRALVASGLSFGKTGQRVGISLSQVANIVHRRHWRDA